MVKEESAFLYMEMEGSVFFPGLVSRENLSFISQLPCVLDP